MRLLREMTTLATGGSYWQVRLSSGRVLSEWSTITDLKRGISRHAEWLEDLIGSGDIARVQAVTLCTPKGDVNMVINEPYTVFQFSQGMVTLEGKVKTAQVIGVVSDKNTGQCSYAVWDVAVQQLYTGESNVNDFGAWRDGLMPLGPLNLAALDVRL